MFDIIINGLAIACLWAMAAILLGASITTRIALWFKFIVPMSMCVSLALYRLGVYQCLRNALLN